MPRYTSLSVWTEPHHPETPEVAETKDKNRDGRGYSFEMVRARLVWPEFAEFLDNAYEYCLHRFASSLASCSVPISRIRSILRSGIASGSG